MMSRRLCLPLDQWPEIDRERWRMAQLPAGFLEEVKPASTWSPARRRIVAEAYGQWLSFLAASDALNPEAPPGRRLTEERLRGFVSELSARVSPMSVKTYIGGIQRMFAVLEPEMDLKQLALLYRNLKRTAQPSRKKLERMVPAADLFELGLRLMNGASAIKSTFHVATQFRDGLMIASLISCPVRIRNLAMIRIGHHLLFDGANYGLEFSPEETKTGRPYRANLPQALTPYIDRYLRQHRPRLMAARRSNEEPSAGDALWVSHSARPLSSSGVRKAIEDRTKRAFGAHVWPHLFRDCAVTELVDLAPDQIGLAPDLLGHTSLGTTQKHYIQATGMKAHREVQNALLLARQAARERVQPGD